MKPRIFLGSSGKQAKLVRAFTRWLSEVAEVEPLTAVFNPSVSTLDRNHAHGLPWFRRNLACIGWLVTME
jgi:hypothetical protein